MHAPLRGRLFPGWPWWDGTGWINKCDEVEDDTKRESGLLLPVPKQLGAVIVDLCHPNRESAEVPVDTTAGDEGKACLLSESAAATASAWEHMCEQGKAFRAVKELGAE